MLVVITYDVNTMDNAGARRLRRVAKLCERYGITTLKHELSKEIYEKMDSIRFYRLGNSYKNKIDFMGKKVKVEAGEPLLL